MEKDVIIAELLRTASANGGIALGRQRFEAETGIKPHHILKHWPRYGDAVREAGLAPNELQRAYDRHDVARRIADLTRELGQFPTTNEIRVKRTNDPTFPSKGVFDQYSKADLIAVVAAFCESDGGYGDVAKLCEIAASAPVKRGTDSAKESALALAEDGFVYLLKTGRYYKIGKTNHSGRREREIALQLPERAAMVHTIRTDDPEGIEAYWHKRFAAKRKNGEWFDLSRRDLVAFRRRKFM